MSTTWTSLFPDEAQLLGRVFKKLPGQYTITVPAGVGFVRAHALGCGGQGDQWGGSAAYARAIVAVTPGDALTVQVGDCSTASTPGDSWVKRQDGTIIVYADRGRGDGDRGQALLSTGDVTRDGQNGNQITAPSAGGGAVTADQNDTDPVIGQGRGADFSQTRSGDYGCGGHLIAQTLYGNFEGFVADPAGTGLICLEWFNANPNY